MQNNELIQASNTVFHAHQCHEHSEQIHFNTLAPDGTSLASVTPGDWVAYHRLEFAGRSSLFMGFVAAAEPDHRIELRLDAPTGHLIGTLTVITTGADGLFQEQYATVKSPRGIHDLYLVFPDGPVGLDWFVFSTDPDDETAAERDARLQWWREARFGAFIHWGAYSVLARGEWAMYFEQWSKKDYEAEAAALLNPTKFDADAWAQLLAQAGQKYVVITAKHHDGFCLYNTQVRNFDPIEQAPANGLYDIVDFTAYGADPLWPLAQACQRYGLTFCLYYSILDWHHPSQAPIYDNSGLSSMMPGWKERYIAEMKEQLRELIERFNPAVLWFDGDWGEGDWWWTEADGAALYRYLRALKPDLVVNERVKRDCGLGDFRSPEQIIPANGLPYDWETCMTLNENWGYHAEDDRWKSVETLLQNLVDIASKGGNFLLNIGPKADGTIPQESVAALTAVGEWMQVYGESIYGTIASPFPEKPAWGRFTQKSNRLYAHLFHWPDNGRLAMPRLQNAIERISLLDQADVSLSYTVTDDEILIHLPVQAPNPYVSVVALDLINTPIPSV